MSVGLPPPCLARRHALLTAVLAAPLLLTRTAQAADAVNPAVNDALRKYVKRKKYDPVETYIPALLVVRDQLRGFEARMVRDVSGTRQALREGVFKSLRDDVRWFRNRAVADYATSEAAFGTSEEAARTAAQSFFKSLEAYDRVLATALRSGELDLPDARAKLQGVLADLDRVLGLVPAEVVAQAQQVVDAYTSVREEVPDASGAEVQRLERLLQ